MLRNLIAVIMAAAAFAWAPLASANPNLTYHGLVDTSGGDPGAGNLKMNMTQPYFASLVHININPISPAGVSIDSYIYLMTKLPTLGQPRVIGRLRISNGTTFWIDYRITSAARIGNYYQLGVESASSLSTLYANNEVLNVEFFVEMTRRVGAKVARENSTQSITPLTRTNVIFDTVVQKDRLNPDLVNFPDRITATENGWYSVSGNVKFPTTANGHAMEVELVKNDFTVVATSSGHYLNAKEGPAGVAINVGIQENVYLEQGDYITMTAYHDADTAIDIRCRDEHGLRLSMVRFGND